MATSSQLLTLCNAALEAAQRARTRESRIRHSTRAYHLAKLAVSIGAEERPTAPNVAT